MKMRAYLTVSTVVFALVAIVHLIRFVFAWPAEIGTFIVPLSASLICVVAAGALAVWGATLARRM